MADSSSVERRFGRRTTATAVLAAALVFATPSTGAQPLDPRYGARVELLNLRPYSFAGQTSAGGSISAGGVLTEGGAGFSGSPMINVSVSTVPGRGAIASAHIFDQLMFAVAGGGSALVPVRMAGSWSGLGGYVTAFLGLGQGGNLPPVIRQGNGYASEYPLEPGSGFTRSGNQAMGYVGSYIIDALWSVYDGGTFSFSAGVSAQTANGGYLYVDDPLTIALPAGVTFTSLSLSSYAVTPVPEPGTWLLLTGGMTALWLRRRQRVPH